MRRFSLVSIFIICSLRGHTQFTLIPTSTLNNLLSISMYSNNIVVAGRDNYLVKSYDECSTLQSLAVPEPIGFQNYLTRVDTNIAYMLSTNQGANKYKIYKSTDGCNTWVKKLDTSNLYLTQLKFFDANEGIALASLYQMVRTTNGGLSWTPSSYPYIFLTAIEVFDDSTICIGVVEKFAISRDRGHTWTGNLFIQSNPRDFFFLSKDTILATSFQPLQPMFSKSFDGGINWLDIQLPNMGEVYGIHFKNKLEGYVVGKNSSGTGVVLKTTDLGQTWSSFNPPVNSTFIDMKFLNDSIALVSGINGLLMKWNTKATLFTGIKNNFVENIDITVSPNPVQNKLIIKLKVSNVAKVNLSICNALGQLVYAESVEVTKEELDLSFLNSGIYLLKMQSGEKQKTIKLVKE